MEATHLASTAFKVSASDCCEAGSGKRRGRQVRPLFFVFMFWDTGELSTLCQVAEVPNDLMCATTTAQKECVQAISPGQAKRLTTGQALWDLWVVVG